MDDLDWNDSGFPLAHLFTFRCYGTWLHGDERGSTDQFNNQFDTPFLPPNGKWHEFNRQLLKHSPVNLDDVKRKTVAAAVRETCAIRGWKVIALNVRTNHLHIVIAVGSDCSKKALINLKANATRKMREEKVWLADHSPWSENGSRKFLWTEKSVETAVEYVLGAQGKPLE